MKNLVQYLNTLHRLNGSNVNTTAEANINNEYSKRIIEKEESLVEQIIDKLEHNRKVLLTGFAGDGKTTLASLVADRLTNGSVDFSEPIVSFSVLGKVYTIIKDLSEIPEAEAEDLLKKEIEDKDSYLMIVSNTGSIRTKLLGIYKRYANWGGFTSASALETELLRGIECNDNSYQGSIRIGENTISTFNLVKRDNLETAYKVLINILSLEEWDNPTEDEKRSTVYMNVQLLKANDFLAVKRMFMLYRRVYEYGVRLTMRNLLEHFAYTITGNKDSIDCLNDRYLFFDNFFGVANILSRDIEGIRLVRKFSFGKNISSSWKRRIWIGHNIDKLILQTPKCLCNLQRFAPLYNEFSYLNSYFGPQDQESVLNMIYFLNEVDDLDENFKNYIQSYLSSPALLYFLELQEKQGNLSRKVADIIGSIIKDVLRDYCSGMKFQNDSAISGDRIYITMDRKSAIVKQSTQIVTGVFEWNRRTIKIASRLDSRGIYQFILILQPASAHEEILLDLPLLDYFMRIRLGSSLEGIDDSFQKRLDNIKLKLQRLSVQEPDGISLIYKDINNHIHDLFYYQEDDRINVELM